MLENLNNIRRSVEDDKDSTKIEKSLNNRDSFLYKLNISWIRRHSLSK
ncbi:hypothetical protein GNF80_15855 [Clostridium perfringens]|nr:hypothetical protein [Clostridium perfringens]